MTIFAALAVACDDEQTTPIDDIAPLRSDLEQIAAAEVSPNGLLGIGITVVLADGREIAVTAGRSGPHEDAPAYSVDDTVQVVGSITKTFTATRALQLIEEGALSLDATLDRWFAFEGAAAITVRMLLNHTSGLNDCLALMRPEQFGETWSPEALVDLAIDAEPYAAPGGATGWYSNTNAVLLALVVEAVSERSWNENIAAGIADPLDLGTVGYAGAPEHEDTFAEGWYIGGDGWAPALDVIDPSIGWGAGAMVASNRDLARFGRALFDGALFEDRATLASMRAFDAPLADALRTPGEPPQSLGLGLIRYRVGDMTLDGHFGHVLGYQAALFHDPETAAIIAVTANTEGVRVGLAAVAAAGAVRVRLAD